MRSQTLFAYDTDVMLTAAAALVNTRAGTAKAGSCTAELLPDVAALEIFLNGWRWVDLLEGTEAELEAVQLLRLRLRRVWQAEEYEAVQIVNAVFRETIALPQVVKHDGWNYHLHAEARGGSVANRIAADVAVALTEVIRLKKLDRLRVCSADDCEQVLVDLSKNASRRYCDANCGNRFSTARFRARQRERISST